jgi:hypothetical protein
MRKGGSSDEEESRIDILDFDMNGDTFVDLT